MSADQVILVDDDGDALLSLMRALKTTNVNAALHAATNQEKALSLIKQFHPQVAVVDLSLVAIEGVESGFRLIKEILICDATCRIVVLTGHSNIDCGVRALNLGAANFIEKPADIAHLAALISDGIKQSSLRRAYRDLRIKNTQEFATLIGSSEKINKVKEALNYASKNSSPVLLSGETGTGKGLCAGIIHRNSARAERNFVRYQPNFSSADLVNSDLFGHVKGAFTGAALERKGLLFEAQQGTLFLDEIDELPIQAQVALLGVLQDKKFRALGANIEQSTDFRLICATNNEISQCLKDGKLRKDFYHRIAHFTICIPPLRDRSEDIEDLAQNIFSKLIANEDLGLLGIDKQAFAKLRNYNWPGNVRELEAVVEGAAYRARYAGRNYVAYQDFLLDNFTHSNSKELGFHQQMKNFKLKIIKDKIEETGGNQARAAKELGLDRTSLRRHLMIDS